MRLFELRTGALRPSSCLVSDRSLIPLGVSSREISHMPILFDGGVVWDGKGARPCAPTASTRTFTRRLGGFTLK